MIILYKTKLNPNYAYCQSTNLIGIYNWALGISLTSDKPFGRRFKSLSRNSYYWRLSINVSLQWFMSKWPNCLFKELRGPGFPVVRLKVKSPVNSLSLSLLRRRRRRMQMGKIIYRRCNSGTKLHGNIFIWLEAERERERKAVNIFQVSSSPALEIKLWLIRGAL